MIKMRPADERGKTRIDWLESYHTFSFNRYHDPRQMGFRVLRVINEDFVKPGRGFGTHPHRDMEILTWVLEGRLAHKDSTGSGGMIGPGEIQRMTAGTGITHSEFNYSQTEPVHLYQIWILPEKPALPPTYEKKTFDLKERTGKWTLLASREPQDGAIKIHQDVRVFASRLEPGCEITCRLGSGRHAWVQATRGKVNVNGHEMESGDGAAASDQDFLSVHADTEAEVLLFDLS